MSIPVLGTLDMLPKYDGQETTRAHTAYQAHAVLSTSKKHTALIKRIFEVGEAKYSTSGQVRASTRRQGG